MSRSLDDLSKEFKPLAMMLLARLVEAQIHVIIVETLRTSEKQAQNVLNKVSWVQHSKHQDGNAIDIVPLIQYNINGSNKLDWDSNDPIWTKIGTIGEMCNLTWGGRWKQKDMGHFELKEATPIKIV